MNFDSTERDLLGQLADQLIPSSNGMPSASESGVAERWLDEVLTARPDLAAKLKDVLAKVTQADAATSVARLRSSDPAAFEVLAEIVPAAYFMNPAVRTAIGYDGQTPRPIDPKPDYMEDGLLESVIRRGPIYRPTP